MKKGKVHMDEKILVCVSYGPTGERLIRRSCEIANALGCPLYILTVDPEPFDDLDVEKTDYIKTWKRITDEEHQIEEFILKDNEKRPATKVIAQVAREKHITQIILGQTAQSRWEEIAKGSIINVLLREIPFIDLHVISIGRALKNEDGFFEKGIRAYLIQEDDKYRLSFNHTKDVLHEGIFFKELGTDFNNGIFKFINNNKTLQVQVTDDYISDFKHVNTIPPLINKDFE